MNRTTDSIRSACTAQMIFDTPLGPLLLARTAHGLAGAWFENQRHHPAAFDAPYTGDDPLLTRVGVQLHAYFGGARAAFDVPLDLQGTPFQRAVWQALLAIEPGSTRSYADIAREIGKPVAMRAVGAAVGKNPVSILVPCHRVIGSDGSQTGYAGGLDRKTALLRLEAARIRPPPTKPPRAFH
jgi:methylated-DNA-[protein]-cysteine S-methyltransferase